MYNKEFYNLEKEDAKLTRSEMRTLLCAERNWDNDRDSVANIRSDVQETGCGYLDGSELLDMSGLEYQNMYNYILVSGHAKWRAKDRLGHIELLFDAVKELADNLDFFCFLDDAEDGHVVRPMIGSDGHTADGTAACGKTTIVVQFAGSNTMLVVERYAHGLRIASCWNTKMHRYGLFEKDDFAYIDANGTVSKWLTPEVFRFRRKERV